VDQSSRRSRNSKLEIVKFNTKSQRLQSRREKKRRASTIDRIVNVQSARVDTRRAPAQMAGGGWQGELEVKRRVGGGRQDFVVL